LAAVAGHRRRLLEVVREHERRELQLALVQEEHLAEEITGRTRENTGRTRGDHGENTTGEHGGDA
jgi:hypothetical protein